MNSFDVFLGSMRVCEGLVAFIAGGCHLGLLIDGCAVLLVEIMPRIQDSRRRRTSCSYEKNDGKPLLAICGKMQTRDDVVSRRGSSRALSIAFPVSENSDSKRQERQVMSWTALYPVRGTRSGLPMRRRVCLLACRLQKRSHSPVASSIEVPSRLSASIEFVFDNLDHQLATTSWCRHS